MPPQPMRCQVENCEFETAANLATFDNQFKMLELHLRMAHPQLAPAPGAASSQAAGGPKPDKLPRPTISEGITQTDWVWFEDRWARYKRSTGLHGQSAVDQLWACASDGLARSCYDSGVSSTTEEEALLKAMKRLAIRAQNRMVNIVDFLSMGQDNDEPIAMFLARLLGQAKICEFTVKCSEDTCARETSYADNMVAHQLVRGMEDSATQEKVLALAATQTDMSLRKITEFVEAQEQGTRSSKMLGNGVGALNRISDYKSTRDPMGRLRSNTLPAGQTEKEVPVMEQGKCGWCGRVGHGRRPNRETRQDKCKAFSSTCRQCNKIGHFEVCCRSKGRESFDKNKVSGAANSVEVREDENFEFFNLTAPSRDRKMMMIKPRTLGHHAVDDFGKWLARKPEPQPDVVVSVSLSTDGYKQLSIPEPQTHKPFKSHSLPDTGAQMVVCGINLVHKLGVKRKELIPLANGINAANNQGIKLLGGILITITGTGKDGRTRESNQLCYVAEGLHRLFLSKTTCRDLGIINPTFPDIGTFDGNIPAPVYPTINKCSMAPPAKEGDKPDGDGDQYVDAEQKGQGIRKPCKCPLRTIPPPAPSHPPFECTEENIPKLKEWILRKYESSAFNCCENQPLPLIQGSPPMALHVDTNAKPVAAHKPAPVPLHWQQEVKEGIDNDVALGVLEKVGVDEPTTWCSRMVVCAKKDGRPRRTVDLKALNKVSVRQTHSVKAPFHQATSVPANTWRTCLDAWNGFHSIPLKEEDRHYTTFITPWGRYRYRCLPQGHLAAGDGYTARYDLITRDFDNYERCIDDTCLWSNTIEGCFSQTCNYLSLCAGAGILFSKKKFQFCSRNVEFLGFQLDGDTVKPTSAFLEAIRGFPTPTDVTGIRSWFGLVEQCSYAFSKTGPMEPFRPLLKPSAAFHWTEELQKAFEDSKEEIIRKVEHGIRTFDIKRKTCLQTDWSKTGIGFLLMQKTCDCETLTPLCCNDGWVVAYAGSRFTTGAESRYSPVEGEMLAAAWAMKKCRHFILGCDSFLLAVDHKPLLSLLGQKDLEEIENPRLQNLKEKTMRYAFDVTHVPGKLNKGADATSRMPVGGAKNFLATIRMKPSKSEEEESHMVEEKLKGIAMSSLYGIYHRDTPSSLNAIKPRAVTWERVEAAAAADPDMIALTRLLKEGAPEEKSLWPEKLKEYYQVRKNLTVQGSVVLYHERVVLPASLRSEVLDVLHSSHGGVSSMVARASSSVWWPQMQDKINSRRTACRSCDISAPSQPAAPASPLPSPEYPFDMICSDFFSYGGHKYLIIVDRFSNWISVYKVDKGGAETLVKLLRRHFVAYGASSELASDGGPEYVASVTQKFLSQWGVHHRLASAYHPHSNQRAELGTKIAKRLIRENTDQSGSLDNDSFARSMLNYRNTPCRDTKLSPAEIIYGRPIKDHLPRLPVHYRPRKEWTLTRERRELALAQRYARQEKLLNEHTKVLPSLNNGDCVSIQNQSGPRAKKWDRTGMIVETLPHQQYRVRVHGSGRITLRNRQFLRRITPLQQAPSIPMPNIEDDTPPEPLNETQDIQGPDMSYDDNIEHSFNDLLTPLPSSTDAPPPDAHADHSAVVPRPGPEPGIASAPVLRRSSRPAKPNRMFDDYIMG